MSRNMKLATLIASGSIFAASAGVLGAVAVTNGVAQAPTTTTTITVSNGEPGPAGPAGPPGPAGEDGAPGAEGCPVGSKFGELVINHPSGHVTIWTCLKNE
jgi:hypothetical protein